MKPVKPMLVLSLVALLAGCATVAPSVPEGYKGAVVRLEDTGYPDGSSKAAFFVALSIDGIDINNSLRQTRMASSGQGFYLSPRYIVRDVPVRPMKVKLTGTHQTGAPIHEIAARMAGTFFSVEGTVDFKPVEGKYYSVNGELKKEQSCVWIEEAASKELSTEKVCTK